MSPDFFVTYVPDCSLLRMGTRLTAPGKCFLDVTVVCILPALADVESCFDCGTVLQTITALPTEFSRSNAVWFPCLCCRRLGQALTPLRPNEAVEKPKNRNFQRCNTLIFITTILEKSVKFDFFYNLNAARERRAEAARSADAASPPPRAC